LHGVTPTPDLDPSPTRRSSDLFTNDGISAGGQVITNVAPGVDGTDAVNVDQLTGLANTPLTFAGDAGTDVDRLLGETVNLVGGASDGPTLTGGNIGVGAGRSHA